MFVRSVIWGSVFGFLLGTLLVLGIPSSSHLMGGMRFGAGFRSQLIVGSIFAMVGGFLGALSHRKKKQ